MRHSLIINTACGDAHVAGQKNPYRSRRYGERAELLRAAILPRAIDGGFDDIIVAGIFPQTLSEAFDELLWIKVPPQRHNRWDGLFQREVGARFASGDLLTFCHDDHAPQKDYATEMRQIDYDWDIIVPERIHGITGESMNNGKDEGYMGGHCYTMKRWLWASMPLTSAPDEWWDIWFTPKWLQLGAEIVWEDSIQHFDMEATAAEA